MNKAFIYKIRVLVGRGFLIDCSVLIPQAIFLMIFCALECKILIKDILKNFTRNFASKIVSLVINPLNR